MKLSMTSSCSLLLLVLATTCHVVSGYAEGPPLSSCVDMMPDSEMGPTGMEGHESVSQNIWPTYGRTKIPPYGIQVHRSFIHYYPNEQISVSVAANQSTGHNIFTGVILQARKVVCADNNTIQVEDLPHGIFILPTIDKTLLKTMECSGIAASSVGHKSPQWKINETFTWQAPDTSLGNLVFKATLVQEDNIYWTDVYSSIIRDPTVPEPMICATSRVTVSVYAIILVALLTAT